MLLRSSPSPPHLAFNLRPVPNSPLRFRNILLPRPFLCPLPPASLRCRASSMPQDAVDSVATPRAEAAPVQSEAAAERERETATEATRLIVGIGSPGRVLPSGFGLHRMSLGDQAFFLLAFIACTTSVAFTSLVVAAIPTLLAMKRAALSLARLADTAREELPSTMAAIRLSGMEISDLTLELNDLSQEIADGVSKSAQAVQAAEAGIRQIGALARSRTISMIQERANLPNISVKPVVVGAAKKTSHVVGQATKRLMNIISGTNNNAENEDISDKVEI